VDGTGSGSCPTAGFPISVVESPGYATRKLVTYKMCRRSLEFKMMLQAR
jgi:hypothetical protein